MSGQRDRPAGPVRRVLCCLLCGTRGTEVLEDLDREYSALCERYTRAVAWGWYLIQVLRPATWRLAWALRRIHEVEGESSAPARRRGRRRTWMSGLHLDLKLAWRMLRKSPGLTVVGVLGIALGTAVETGFFVVLSNKFYPTLPLEEGDRIVALQYWDAEAYEAAGPSLHDFVTWRKEMRSLEQLAAASIGPRALVTGDAAPQMVRAAAMTATGFQVARVPPLLGRYLLPEDERAGAARVVVIGYDLWQTRFGGDPGVVGRRVLVGGVEHTVVGVMPPGFALPQNQELWTALRTSPTRYERGEGPELFVFGRLATGATREQAQAELTAIGRRAAAAFTEEGAGLRPQVRPYTYPLENIESLTLWEVAQIELMVSLLLIAIAVNVAVLVYARTAMRQQEIGVRSALGASRRRIVGQLFVEALLFSGLGAGLGLLVAHLVLLQMEAIFAPGAFWVHWGLQPRSVAFALALAILSAVIVGVVPGLKSTGRSPGVDLRRLGSGASVGLGRGWTALIVIQVAVAVSVLPTAMQLGFDQLRFFAVRSTFRAHEFLGGRLGLAVPLRPGMNGEGYRREVTARFAERLPELERRLEAEPSVAGVTFEGSLPGRSVVEVEAAPETGESRDIVLRPATGVASDYFEVLGARILAGRGLRASDVGAAGIGLVVTEAFARDLGDGPALGRRIRFVTMPETGGVAERTAGPWPEIVGVVQNLSVSAFDRELAGRRAYYAVAPGELRSVELLIHVRGDDAEAFAPRFRQITAAVDPDLRIGSLYNLATLRNPRYLAMAVAILLAVLGTVVLLSAAGMHALMSLAVTRRRKEIGVRTALGARPSGLLASIFSRAAWQLGLGGFLGAVLGGALLLGNGLAWRDAAIYLGGVVVLMLTAGLLATLGPARRGLGIQPMEALKE